MATIDTGSGARVSWFDGASHLASGAVHMGVNMDAGGGGIAVAAGNSARVAVGIWAANSTGLGLDLLPSCRESSVSREPTSQYSSHWWVSPSQH